MGARVSVLSALQTVLKCRHSAGRGSAALWDAEQRAEPDFPKAASKGSAEECPVPSRAQLPGLQATSELDCHSAGNKAQAEGLEVCTDRAGWRELVQP